MAYVDEGIEKAWESDGYPLSTLSRHSGQTTTGRSHHRRESCHAVHLEGSLIGCSRYAPCEEMRDGGPEHVIVVTRYHMPGIRDGHVLCMGNNPIEAPISTGFP